MRYFNLDGIVTYLPWSHRRMQMSTFVAVFSLILVTCTLVSCGSSTTSATSVPSPTSTHIVLSTPRPFPSSTPKPTAILTPVPTATPAPVLPATPTPVIAQGAPAILDLRPSSMSIVGHLDCQKMGPLSALPGYYPGQVPRVICTGLLSRMCPEALSSVPRVESLDLDRASW
jgi:hypothetical protein